MPSRKRKAAPRASREDPDWFEDDDGIDDGDGSSGERLQQLILDLLGRWYWIALGLVLGILGAFYFLSKAPEIFEAKAALLVKQGSSSILPGDRQEDDMDYRSDDAVNTVAERIKRIDLLTKVASTEVVQSLPDLIPPGVNWLPGWSQDWLGGSPEDQSPAEDREPKSLAKRIQKWMSVEIRRNTRLLDIVVAHPSPEVAKVLADTIATEYVKELATERLSGDTSSSDILGSSAEEVQADLQESQNALANYQQVLETLKELEAQELIFSELDRRYTPKHPKHIGAKATVSEYQRRFLVEFDSVRRALVDKDYWEMNRAEWDQIGLDDNSRLSIAKRLLTARASVLQSEIINKTEFYNAMLTKLQLSNVNKESLDAEVGLSSLSELPERPSSPKKMIVLAGGTLLGAGLGFGFALLLTKLDNKIHTVRQAELLSNLPVLATIGKIDPKILAKIVARKGVGADPSPARKKWDPRIVFRPGLSDSLFAEMFRILRASVSLLGNEKNRKVTLFSSALPEEGKTLVAANFAIASAQQGNKTLLIDLDLRKPAVHRAFGLHRKELGSGATELLAGQATLEEAISEVTGQENLFCIFAGVKAPNPGELLTLDSVNDLLERLEGKFEVIVIDSAPLLAISDTRLIIPAIDNFCLVVRAEQTPKGAVRKTLARLKEDGNEPAGIVVNGYEEKAGFLRRKYGGGYEYGAYGHYGKGYGSYGSDGSDDDD